VRRDQNRVRVNAQLIDADSGAHLWADQFDTARADLLQMQDEIVARIANALGFELLKAETQRSALSTNPDAMDLAMRCITAVRKAGYFGTEAEAGYRLCEQALDADPNNVLALTNLARKFYLPVFLNRSADPQADLKRANELASRVLALDANSSAAHSVKGHVLRAEKRFDDAIAEYERALALDPNFAYAVAALGDTYSALGQYEKAVEFYDKAIRLSPHDPDLSFWYWGKSSDYFALQQYDQAIEWARRSIAINPNFGPPHGILAAALALTGHEAEARDAAERYAVLRKFKSIAAVKAAFTPPPSADPRVRASSDRWLGRLIEGLRKAGMPEE
jgi:tetratricopeptide (TPR) repeat protein